MEKVCEFCVGLQPIVYCTADAAFLCLACDARVHSANALSNRHSRSLVCQSCRQHPAYLRCLSHRMMLCHGCDQVLHKALSQHQKSTLSSFTGCPTAGHFAQLFGFDMNELETSYFSVDQSGSGLGGSSSMASSAISSSSIASVGCQTQKVNSKDHPQENSVMRQILDLENLQLTEGSTQSSLIRREGYSEASSSLYNPCENPDEFLDQYSKELQGPMKDLQKLEGTSQDLKGENFSSPISQLERMQGDPFWPCKSPVRNSQFWSQNLEELGVCEELDRLDDLNMPDMDGTFCNFEELFGGDQDINSTLLNDGIACSFVEKGRSVGLSGNSHMRGTEDLSASSSVGNGNPIITVKHATTAAEVHLLSGSLDSPFPVPSVCSPQFSLSRLSTESFGSDCLDSGHSGNSVGVELSGCGADAENTDNVVWTFKGRRKARSHWMQTRFSSLKFKPDAQKRAKFKLTKTKGSEKNAMKDTGSY